MYNFEPENYHCPFCLLRDGVVNEHVESRQSDIIYQDDEVMSFICSWQFVDSEHEGHVLVVPKGHYENLFDIPSEVLAHLSDRTKLISQAMMLAYECDGITVWQNNGPAAIQTVWHYHVHLIPRVTKDTLFQRMADLDNSFQYLEEGKRAAYAENLRAHVAARLVRR